MSEQAGRTLMIANTEARKFMDETVSITDREAALQAIHKLWRLHKEMEEMAKPDHPAILSITRTEIRRLKVDFGISTEEELQIN